MRSILRLVVLAATALVIVRGDTFGKDCQGNDDCAAGATCVAGDSEQPVQRCVAGKPCGGATLGGCPGDDVNGQLACVWRPDTKTCSTTPRGCKEIDGTLGIYKCVSLARCDKYFGDGECSASCNVDGKQCNGRGLCQFASGSSDGTKLQCACESGWNGTRCETPVDDSCVVDAGQCGEHGTCVNNSCQCKNGYKGVQCEIPPSGISSSGSGSLIDGSSSKGTGSGSKTKTPSPAGSKNPNSSASRATAEKTAAPEKSSGSSTLAIIIAIIAALIVAAAIFFFVYARRKRQEQEAAGGNEFGRADSINANAAGAGAPTTPKQRIVIM